MAIRIQFRRGSAADWATANPVLAAGELGYESDTGQIKIGNGSTTWSSLSYGAVSESYVNDAISNVVGLAPETLDTLNELANAIGNDPSFITSITSDISNAVIAHNGTTANVHGIANTLALETETGAQEKADLALGDAQSYTDNAIATLVESAPSTLNTLNELAAALGDDPNFATSIANTIGTKLTFVADTAENFATANAVTAANTIYVETNAAGYIKVGNGVAHYNSLDWVGQSYADIVVTAHNEPNSNAHGISDFTALALTSDVTQSILDAISTHSDDTSNVHGIANTLALVANTEALLSDVTDLQTETGSLQTQIDGKLGTSVAASTYAPLANPTFTGTVVLPITTSIDGVSGTEIGYLNNVTSSIQTQLDAKAPIADPTFTGTVSGITKSMVGLNNVNNTADANKPVSTATQTALDLKADLSGPTFTGTVVLPSTTSIGSVSAAELGYVDGVTSAIQTQLDDKLSLGGGTLTGALTLSGAPTSDLHAATKLYVDGIAAGINFHQPVVAATSGNLDGTYNNGTSGVGATLTKASNGAIGTIDGASVSVGNRILLRAQTDPKQNGVYVVTAVGSAGAPWVITRATDADNNPAGELATGDFTFVTSGSTNGSKGFILNTTGTITVGTTDINYTQFNASEAVTAGNGITKSGSTLSIASQAITSDMIANDTIVDADINASAAIAQSKISGLSTSLGLKANLATPSFTGGVTVDSSGVVFTDGAQTKAGVPSLTSFVYKTGSYTLDSLTLRDGIIEVANAAPSTITIPLDSTINYPVGTSIDVIQTLGGQVTIAPVSGSVTVNATPGLKLRTQWSSATLLKRAANTWIVYGDLTA